MTAVAAYALLIPRWLGVGAAVATVLAFGVRLAVSLAAQDSLKNLFGSITIFLDRPFLVGSFINYSGNMGTVEEIGFRGPAFATGVAAIGGGHQRDDGVDVGVGGRLVHHEQRRRAHDLPRLAVAALRHAQRRPGGLHGLCDRPGYAVDGGDGAPLDLRDGRDAGAPRRSVHMHGAGAAQRFPATEFRAGQAEIGAQERQQAPGQRAAQLTRRPVHNGAGHRRHRPSSRSVISFMRRSPYLRPAGYCAPLPARCATRFPYIYERRRDSK